MFFFHPLRIYIWYEIVRYICIFSLLTLIEKKNPADSTSSVSKYRMFYCFLAQTYLNMFYTKTSLVTYVVRKS